MKGSLHSNSLLNTNITKKTRTWKEKKDKKGKQFINNFLDRLYVCTRTEWRNFQVK